MSVPDRGWMFVFSLGVMVACLAVAVWLMATGQAAYVDGLFLLISSLVLALAFGLYLGYLIRGARDEAPGPKRVTSAAGVRKAAAPAAAEKSAATGPA
jgi:hypothetical protein